MAFDFKKEYRHFYLPPAKPMVVALPPMNYVAVRGESDPNAEGSAYKRSIELLYGISYTIKMSKMGNHAMAGYFDFVVPPLEGLWWTDGEGFDYKDKSRLRFVSMIRLPDFVQRHDFEWAVAEASQKKKTDFSSVEFFTYDEGLCVQCMHIGPYDDEPATIASMKEMVAQNGYALDFNPTRHHHEIYLSDPRKTAPEKLKTVIRLPIAHD